MHEKVLDYYSSVYGICTALLTNLFPYRTVPYPYAPLRHRTPSYSILRFGKEFVTIEYDVYVKYIPDNLPFKTMDERG